MLSRLRRQRSHSSDLCSQIIPQSIYSTMFPIADSFPSLEVSSVYTIICSAKWCAGGYRKASNSSSCCCVASSRAGVIYFYLCQSDNCWFARDCACNTRDWELGMPGNTSDRCNTLEQQHTHKHTVIHIFNYTATKTDTYKTVNKHTIKR